MKNNIQTIILLIGYIIASLALFLYSYTQVDLNLTLSRVSVWQVIQKWFQSIGYYNRPLSTGIYMGILVLLFVLYGLVLRLVQRRNIGEESLWRIIWVVVGILVFSYPAAFSYDFFNYMFTAKTVLVYHKSPYAVIPLQFAGIDPWTNFMRWTHLPSAYTPLWIAMTLPAYLLGFGYFLWIMFNIKLLVAGFYLLTCWAIGKTLDEVDKERKALGLAIFALNPLILIETLVGGHNDIVMVGFAMLAVLFLVKKEQLTAWWYLALSIATKLMTIVLIPIFALRRDRLTMFMVMVVGLLIVISRREFLPWYWVWVMPFVALLPRQQNLLILSAGVSAGLLLRYVPYLYLGHYDPPVPQLRMIFLWILIVAVGFLLLLKKFVAKYQS